MSVDLSPVRRVQLWEIVASRLRRAILLGQLRPGTHLVETELAEQLQASRGPVREALRQLELESLVRAEPNGRTLVIGFPREGLEQLYDARLLLELRALELAVPRATASDVARMQAILDRWLVASRDGREDLMAELDLAFHREFFAIADNRVLGQLWGMLRPQIRELLEVTRVSNPRVQSISDMHQAILDAIGEGDVAGARRALERSLAAAVDVLHTWMEQQSDLAGPRPDGAPAASVSARR